MQAQTQINIFQELYSDKLINTVDRILHERELQVDTGAII